MCKYVKNYYVHTSCTDPAAHFVGTSMDGNKDDCCSTGPHERYVIVPGQCSLCQSPLVLQEGFHARVFEESTSVSKSSSGGGSKGPKEVIRERDSGQSQRRIPQEAGKAEQEGLTREQNARQRPDHEADKIDKQKGPDVEQKMAAESSIANRSRSCQSLFDEICAGWELTPSPLHEVSLSSITKESERFGAWARNIAALHDARLPSSLQYRLRNDSGASRTVETALSYLEESLELALSIVSGHKENETWQISTREDQTSRGSEIVELYLSIQDGITNLFQLSTIIRKKPEVDEYIKAQSKFPMDPISDIVGVGDKYSKANEQGWLKVRLGTAVTQRRQYLLYRKDHQERMQEEHVTKVGPDGMTIWSGEKASTYLPEEGTARRGNHEIAITLPLTDQGDLQTNYADSRFAKEGGSSILRAPLLPRGKDGKRADYGEHFECPYCRRIVSVSNKQNWKKHVMSDLRPYVCTFESCTLMMFDSQREWFYHELRFHRQQWKCKLCPNSLEQTCSNIKEHVNAAHAELLETGTESYIESCLLPRIPSSSCPLCYEWASRLQKVNSKGDVSLKQYREHLGLHMEQLALAALPLQEDDSDHSSDLESSSQGSSISRTDDSPFHRLQGLAVDVHHLPPFTHSVVTLDDIAIGLPRDGKCI